MKYYTVCRQYRKNTDSYCPACGAKQNTCPHNHSILFPPSPRDPEPGNKLVQELAYSGIFFWLPLVFCKNDKSKIHSNRGLWILLLASSDCFLSQLLKWVTSYWGSFGKILYGIIVLPCLLFMFFLTGNSVMAALSIHQDTEQEKMLWFDDFKLIGR